MTEDSLDQVTPEEEPGVPRSKGDHYDANFLWRVYVQCQGNLPRMLDYNDPAVPKSVRTLQWYAKKHGWKKKLSDQLSKVESVQVSSIADARQKRLDKLQQFEDTIFDYLMPKKLEDGSLKWNLEPSKFEATLDKFLKLIDRIEVLQGGVTSRTEVKKVVEVNVRIVCTVLGRCVNELVRENVLTLKSARSLVDRFQSRIAKQDILLETEMPMGATGDGPLQNAAEEP